MDAAKNFLVLRACQWSDLEQPTSHLANYDPRGLPASWDLPEHSVLWTFPCSHSNVLVRGCAECAKQWEYPAEETRQLSKHLHCRIKGLRQTPSEVLCKNKTPYTSTDRSHRHYTRRRERKNVAYKGISILINKIRSVKLWLYLVEVLKWNPNNKTLCLQGFLSWSSRIHLSQGFTCVLITVRQHLYKISVYKYRKYSEEMKYVCALSRFAGLNIYLGQAWTNTQQRVKLWLSQKQTPLNESWKWVSND